MESRTVGIGVVLKVEVARRGKSKSQAGALARMGECKCLRRRPYWIWIWMMFDGQRERAVVVNDDYCLVVSGIQQCIYAYARMSDVGTYDLDFVL